MAVQKLTPGMPVATGPIRSAGFQNTLVDIVDWWRQHGLGKGRGSNPSSPPTDIIKIKNITGTDRKAGQVLEIGTPLLTTLDRHSLWFNADAVSHATRRSYAILKRPIPSGEIDEAHISGVCVAKVDIQATTDRYAFVETSSYNLKSGSAGQFRLLGPLTSTGVQDVAVIFADPQVPSYFHHGAGGFGNVGGTLLDCTWGTDPDVSGDFSWNDPDLTWNGTEGAKAKLRISTATAISGTPSGSEFFSLSVRSDYPGGFPTSLDAVNQLTYAVASGDKNLTMPLSWTQRFVLHQGAKYRLSAQRILGSSGSVTLNMQRVYWSFEVYL